jgi:hypothetical protein
MQYVTPYSPFLASPIVLDRDNLIRHTRFHLLFLLSLFIVKSQLFFYGALLIWSMKGVRHSMISITLLNLIVLLNSSLLPSGAPYRVLWWVAIVACSIRILVDAVRFRLLSHPVLPALLFFSITVVFLSVISLNIPVSLAKILSFTLVSVALLLGFKITILQKFDWSAWFMGQWLSVLILSIPTYFISDIGYFRDPNGLQGILNHPQVFGIYFSVFIAWMLGMIYFGFTSVNRIYSIVLFVSIVFIYLSRARTSLASLALSVSFLSVFSIVIKRQWGVFAKKFVNLFVFLIVLVFASALYTSDGKSSRLEQFLFKDSEANSVDDALKMSRGSIIEESWASFLENPFAGIGFGITKNEYFTFEIDPRTGLPVSAATEKAFLPVVLLEEVGLIGTFCFLPYFLSLLKSSFSTMDLRYPLIFLTAFFTNIGEMIFFSIGGVGLYVLIFVYYASNCGYLYAPDE